MSDGLDGLPQGPGAVIHEEAKLHELLEDDLVLGPDRGRVVRVVSRQHDGFDPDTKKHQSSHSELNSSWKDSSKKPSGHSSRNSPSAWSLSS